MFTWAQSSVVLVGLGGYIGLLVQHQKYGGQLFIQEKIGQTEASKRRRFILRFLIVFSFGLLPMAIMITVVGVVEP